MLQQLPEVPLVGTVRTRMLAARGRDPARPVGQDRGDPPDRLRPAIRARRRRLPSFFIGAYFAVRSLTGAGRNLGLLRNPPRGEPTPKEQSCSPKRKANRSLRRSTNPGATSTVAAAFSSSARLPLGAAIGGAGILAAAATGGSTSTTAPSTASGSSGAPSQAPTDPAKLSHGPDETLLTGTTADKVKAAALAADPGATIIRVETDSAGSPYEAHITKADGTQVTLKIDASFKVTSTEQGFGAGPGGQGPGGNGPDGQAPGGAVRAGEPRAPPRRAHDESWIRSGGAPRPGRRRTEPR